MSDGSNNNSGNGRQPASSLQEELLSFCDSDLLSVEGIHQIIKHHRRITPNYKRMDKYFFCWAALKNKRVTEEIMRCLFGYFPEAPTFVSDARWSMLHFACRHSPIVKPNIIRFLIDAAPESVRSANDQGEMPLHILCNNFSDVDEAAVVQILKLLVEKYPEAARHADEDSLLPIHIAAASKSPEFCRVLIDSYPGSERMPEAKGNMSLHIACAYNSLATVKYMHSLYPEAIDQADAKGFYPIHAAISTIQRRNNPAVAAKIVRFLLDCDPNQEQVQFQGRSLLLYGCLNVKVTTMQLWQILFDADPYPINHEDIVANNQNFPEVVKTFIGVVRRYIREHHRMTTPDVNRQLPLHKALQKKARLGVIKLLVKGNPAAVQSSNNSNALPLHMACEFHLSSTVQYLLGLDETALDAVDRYGNTVLHYACRGARYDTIALLLEKYDAVSVSKRNADGKLPIDLLWESNAVNDRESVEYTGSVFQLVRAYPEMVQSAIR